MTVMFGYIYNADGDRVAKGTITSWSCDPSANGFVATANYVLDQAGHQLSRFAPDSNATGVPTNSSSFVGWSNGKIVLDYTNVYAAGTRPRFQDCSASKPHSSSRCDHQGAATLKAAKRFTYPGTAVIGTYDGNNLHFYLNDWLGTRRAAPIST